MSSHTRTLIDGLGTATITSAAMALHGRAKVALTFVGVGATLAGTVTLEGDHGGGEWEDIPVDGSAYALAVTAAGTLTDVLEPVAYRRLRAKWTPTEGNTSTSTVVVTVTAA